MKKLFFSIFLSLFLTSVASAATVISPITELEADPGTTVNGIVKLYNETTSNLVLTSEIEQFTTGDETGVPVFIPEQNKNDFLQWFSLAETELLMLPGQVAIIPFEVTVPVNAVPGGYYSAIFWKDLPVQQGEQKNLAISTRVGTLVFLKVKGEIIESANLLSFGTVENKKVFYGLPVNFIARVENTGNVHLQPKGTITLTNIFGQTKNLELTDGKQSVLPNSTRQFEVFWGSTNLTNNFLVQYWNKLKEEFSSLSFGPYSAKLNLSYGSGDQVQLNSQTEFWVVPIKLIGELVGGLIIIIIFFKVNSKINKLKKKKVKNEVAVEQK